MNNTDSSSTGMTTQAMAHRNRAYKGHHTRFERRIASAQNWHRAEGSGVVLHYLPEENPPDVITDKVERFNWALCQNYALFQVEPLDFKVRIYLFPDAAAHGQALGQGGPEEGAQALYHGASMVNSTWEDSGAEEWGLKYLAVHEQAHVVHWKQMYGLYYPLMPNLFSEGGAVWAQNQVPDTAFATCGGDAPAITEERSLRTLLEEGWGFDYSHVGAFYGYMIARPQGGMDNMKAFMRRLSQTLDQDDAVRVDTALRAIYGLSLEEIEAEWRSAFGAPPALPVQPLHRAAARNQEQVARFWLAQGVDINERDHRLNTPLITTSFYGARKAMRVLLEHGADVDAQNEDKATALFWCACLGDPAGARMLIAAGARPHIPNICGYTALMAAAQEGHRRIVEAAARARSRSDRANGYRQDRSGLAAAKRTRRHRRTFAARHKAADTGMNPGSLFTEPCLRGQMQARYRNAI